MDKMGRLRKTAEAHSVRPQCLVFRLLCRAREGELPRRGKRSWPGPRLGALSRSVPNFAAKDGAFFSRTQPRAASSFAHGGKGTKTPPGFAQDERSALIFALPTPSGPAGHLPTPFVPSGHFPLTGGVGPGPRIRGLSSMSDAKFPARKIRSAWVRFLPGPQGPWVRKICFWCGPAFAPEFFQPTLPVQFPS